MHPDRSIPFYARQLWSMYCAHPWLLQLTNARRMPGPNAMTRTDAAVSEVGLKPEEMVAVGTSIGQFLAERETGVSEEDWWHDRDGLWEHFTSERLPMMTHIWTTGGYERPLDEFEFGLARVLDGLAVFIEGEEWRREARAKHRQFVERRACSHSRHLETSDRVKCPARVTAVR